MEAPEWRVVPEFAERVRAVLGERGRAEDTTVLRALCPQRKALARRGRVSGAGAGSRTCNVSDGFEGDRNGQNHRSSINGWRHHGLPWEQG